MHVFDLLARWLRRQKISKDVILGKNVYIGPFINLYGCRIGDETKIGAFVEVQRGVTIGRRCKIGSHSFVCDGVTIEDEVFIGHGVMFVNDNHPVAATRLGTLETAEDWQDRFVRTKLRSRVVVGTNATILGGVTIGEGAVIGAGAVVTKDVLPGQTVCGNPAKPL